MTVDERCASWEASRGIASSMANTPTGHDHIVGEVPGHEYFLVPKYRALKLDHPRFSPSGWLLPGCPARTALACCGTKSVRNPTPGDLTCDQVSGSSRFARHPGQTIHSGSDRVAHGYRPIPQRRCHFSSAGVPASLSGPHSPCAGDGFAVARRVSHALEVASPLFQNKVIAAHATSPHSPL